MARVAILDDYQGVARRMTDWAALPAGTDVSSYGSVVVWCVPFGVTFAVASFNVTGITGMN